MRTSLLLLAAAAAVTQPIRFDAGRMGNDELDIAMKDIRYDIQVVLRYRLHPTLVLIGRSATILNRTSRARTM